MGIPSYTGDGNRYLVIGLGPQPAAELAQPPEHTELIAYGPLLSDDGVNWLGTAALVRAQNAVTARTVLAEDTYIQVEVHNWQPGGRPS